MKIISHNVNGLKSYINSGKLNALLKFDADIYCFQEVKVQDIDQLEDLLEPYLDDYCVYSQECLTKKGYAGVLFMVKNDINHEAVYPEDSLVFGDTEYASGRIIQLDLDDNISLINVYVVNSAKKELERLLFDEKLKNYVKSLIEKGRKIILLGDMNVCSTELDFWGNYDIAKNLFPGLCKFEIDGFHDLLNECQLNDTFRMLHPDERKYSWCSPKTKNDHQGWRLDYFLTTKDINIKESNIYQGWNTVGDHSPIELII